jgi:hypothetical protein
MKLIKPTDASDFEADMLVINERLSKFLNDFRKTQTARDLIGNDERSGDFDVDDFKAFAERLSAGVELSTRDKRRISERASKLAKRRLEANHKSANKLN